MRQVLLISDKKTNSGRPIELKLLMSGVVRPPLFAQTVLLLPVILANYAAFSNPDLARLANQWTPYGGNPWIDIAYVVLESVLVMGFMHFIVAVEFPTEQIPRSSTAHITRLTFIGGAFLALAVVVLPVLERFASGATGTTIPMSGFDVELVAAVVLAVVAGLERSAVSRPSLSVPSTYMP